MPLKAICFVLVCIFVFSYHLILLSVIRKEIAAICCCLFRSLFDSNSNRNMSLGNDGRVRFLPAIQNSYLEASSIATATATVIPTMGLLPAPMSPIIST